VRKLTPDRELEAFLYPALGRGLIRKALDAAEAGCVVLALEESNWIASIFAGRWAYNVRVERDQDGRPARAWCDCSRVEQPCVHAIATWIVWAAGAVASRPPRPRERARGTKKSAVGNGAGRVASASVESILAAAAAYDPTADSGLPHRARGSRAKPTPEWRWHAFPPQARDAVWRLGFGFERCDYGWMIRSGPAAGRYLIRVRKSLDGRLAARAAAASRDTQVPDWAQPADDVRARVDAALNALAKGQLPIEDGPEEQQTRFEKDVARRTARFAATMAEIRRGLQDAALPDTGPSPPRGQSVR